MTGSRSERDVTTGAGEVPRIGGYPVWSDELRLGESTVQVRFVGRGDADRAREVTLATVEPTPLALAALRQVHSARIVRVESGGGHGEGDALVTATPGLALSVITADCVPVLVATRDEVAAIHAGWRGIVAGVVPAALATLAPRDADTVAWIGPAIGPCCYEVGEDVAQQVATAAGVEVATPGPRGKPHLDLRRAVAAQLARAGVPDVRLVGPCTRCHPELLWSYRREGARAGRNIAYVWRAR